MSYIRFEFQSGPSENHQQIILVSTDSLANREQSEEEGLNERGVVVRDRKKEDDE